MLFSFSAVTSEVCYSVDCYRCCCVVHTSLGCTVERWQWHQQPTTTSVCMCTVTLATWHNTFHAVIHQQALRTNKLLSHNTVCARRIYQKSILKNVMSTVLSTVLSKVLRKVLSKVLGRKFWAKFLSYRRGPPAQQPAAPHSSRCAAHPVCVSQQ
jgi:hypothetical protein